VVLIPLNVKFFIAGSHIFPKIKICLIIHSLSAGGMERVMSQLAWYFSKKKNLEIHLVLYGRKREIFYPIPESIILYTPAFKFLNSKRTWHTIKTLLFLRKTVKEIQPDTILSFGELWNNLVLLALHGLKYPVFISDRSRPDKNLGFFHNTLRKILYPHASGIVAQTNKAKKIAESQKRNANIEVIGNPIRNIECGPPVSKENIVLTVGRLIRTKHIDELIKLFVRINEAGWKLVVVGGDAQKQNLKVELIQLVKDQDATDRVTLVGTCSDVDKYYQKAKIFAFTSSSEGFPNVIGEAMSAGLPVISFDCVAGPSEIIRDGKNGFLVDVFDYETFEKRLKQLMDDKELRCRLAAKAEAAIEAFSVDCIGKKYLQFILKSDCQDQTL
jgi:GalNAc-alpha-(1->4)-GalNAc-alpha-(1->3)-diNAcBac-PP-undecaprenol alpha-1,4-N-acetyl-D-galactosaminyltransferase